MKKKTVLFLTIVTFLVCLFAISVNAKRVENYNDTFTLGNETDLVHYEKWLYNGGKSFVRKKCVDKVTLSFIDENGAPLVEVPMWEYDEAEGRYYSLVWYISDWSFDSIDQTYTDDNVGTQTYPLYTHATYTLSKVRAVDLRYLTAQVNTSFAQIATWEEARSLKTLEGIYYDINNTPDDTTDDLKLQDAVGIGRDSDNYGYFGYEAQFEATGNKIVVGNFRDCDFQRDMEGNYGTSNTWSGATNLQCIWYPDAVLYLVGGNLSYASEIDLGDGIEIVACQILRDDKKVKEFRIPNSLLFLGNEAFRGSDLTTLIVGENLAIHGGTPFLYTGGADNVYLSKNLLSCLSSAISNLICNSQATIYFDGNLEEATALMEKIISEDSGNYKGKVTLIDYKEQTERGGIKNVAIFYNYNRCDAFYFGQHDEQVLNSCQFGCGRGCGVVELLENPVHNAQADITFGASVYFDEIDAKLCCKNCAAVIDSDKIDALFVSNGISLKMFGTGAGLAQSFAINREAIASYRKYVSDFNFGILAYANVDKTEAQPKPGDEKVVDIVFDNMANGYVEVKVTGIPEDCYDIPVIFCIYATEGEKFYYVDNGSVTESIVGTSYSSMQ